MLYIYLYLGIVTLAKQHRFPHKEKCFPMGPDLVIRELRINFNVTFHSFLMNIQELDPLRASQI